MTWGSWYPEGLAAIGGARLTVGAMRDVEPGADFGRAPEGGFR